MPRVCKQITVPYSSEQMYELVNDVAAYPQFVPHCYNTEILFYTKETMVAKLWFKHKGVKQSVTTRNQLHPTHTIEMNMLSGPLKFLRGKWCFDTVGKAEGYCQVRFSIEFSFGPGWLGRLFGQVFVQLSEQMVQVFVDRAKEIYGHDG